MRLQLQSGGKNMDSDISTMEAAEAAIRTMRYSNIKRNLERIRSLTFISEKKFGIRTYMICLLKSEWNVGL